VDSRKLLRSQRYFLLIAAFGLLSTFSFPGCSPTWRWIRKGTKIDSLEIAVHRVDSISSLQNQQLAEMNADLLTEIEYIRQELSQVSAKIDDNQSGLSRVYQRLGITRNEPLPSDTASIKTSTPVDPDELYNTAYLDYTRGNYDIAIDGFKRYLQFFPNTELSDNAQYWIGECYYSNKLYPDAVLEFGKVVQNYPQGNKVVSAIYKTGLAYESMNEIKKAKDYYKKVFDNYPNTPEAKLAKERYSSLR
jgi:tol-pal system protein YbgF